MFICMIVHQGHTPCTSIRMFFFAFTSRFISLTNFRSFVVDDNVCFEETQTRRNKNTLLGLQLLKKQARQHLPVFTMWKELLN